MTKGRLEAFSDGVIAIIITIMVLEMKVPHGDGLGALRPLLPVFLSCADLAYSRPANRKTSHCVTGLAIGFARADVRMGLMNQPAISVRNHCLSPARARVAIDAPLGPTSYARMFPDLPSFQADEQFLHALGRAGGVCDCGDIDDSPDSLGDTAAGWPS